MTVKNNKKIKKLFLEKIDMLFQSTQKFVKEKKCPKKICKVRDFLLFCYFYLRLGSK